MKRYQIINGDNIEILKSYPDNYFDSVVTDCPYGLGKELNAEELMKDWIEKGFHEISGSGFMGKEWDAFVPQPIFWKEVFRVLKHGGHVLSFFGTRTYDWGVMAMRFAGFEVRDCIQWLYGSGFPKSHNISKAIDKMYGAEREVVGKGKSGSSETHLNTMHSETKDGKSSFGGEYDITSASTDQAKEWEGWGSALKPANEPIVLARKPLEKGLTIAENVLKWGTGAINIDGCRVGFGNETDNRVGTDAKCSNTSESDFFKGIKNNQQFYNAQGRFPANLILSCSCENENQHNEDCPIKILDEQSGESKSGDIKPHKEKGGGTIYENGKGFFNSRNVRNVNFKGDKGGASRFFYVAKASKSERNKGLEGFEEKEMQTDGDNRNQAGFNSENRPPMLPRANFHPTVKPIKLMQYLVRLITPPNGIVLDPFCGSGTTGVACKLEGFQFIGLEQDAEYCKIAQARIDNYIEDNKVSKVAKNESSDNDNQLNLF